ncbi:MAG: helix-turn-helix domain-containing protein [Eubacteriales bacterium]|nr:helix-turn-helix domain-containing protein [Eubacteriales bacterium]
MTEYYLIHVEGISANTLFRMKQGKSITTKKLDRLCFILDCVRRSH